MEVKGKCAFRLDPFKLILYSNRYIDKLILLRGANRVRLVTHARMIESHKIKEYPIDQLYCKQKVLTGLGKLKSREQGVNEI